MNALFISLCTFFLCYTTLHANEKDVAIHHPSNTIQGTLIYKERMLLPSNSSITVTLEDLPYTDTPTTVIASTTFLAPKSPPFSFTLPYDPNHIDPNRRYTLRATITHKNATLFHSIDHVDAFNAPVTILLRRAGKNSLQRSIENTHWKLLHIEHAAIASSEKLKDPNFILKPGNKVIGFTGCNRFVGTYILQDNRLSFSQITATPMHCSETMETEKAFKEVLDRTKHYKVQGKKLDLFDDTHRIASFRAVHF